MYIESLLAALGITLLMIVISNLYYWNGFNKGAQAFADLLTEHDPEAANRLTKKLISKNSGEYNRD